MLRDLKKLNRIGVFPFDASIRNWRNGKIFDFSWSMTLPHVQLSYGIFSKKMVRVAMDQDFADFDDMISNERIETPIRAHRNLEYCRKLRSHNPLYQDLR